MTSNNSEQEKLILQQTIFDMRWKILIVIELLEKDKKKKALKILKEMIYK